MKTDKMQKKFEKHGFSFKYFKTAEKAAEYLTKEIQGTTVGIGGCMTAEQMKLDEKLSVNNQVFWHWKNPGRETVLAANAAKVYITSANALSEKGEIVNIDGTGNRLAATLYGPERVYVVCGINKVEPSRSAAVKRARNVAAPLNARRLGAKTPCAKGTMKCHNCSSPERICHALLLTERKPNGVGQMEIVLIGQELGY